jgi:hypothetical protein
MNVEVGTEAAQFPEKEYINGIFLAVHENSVRKKLEKGQYNHSNKFYALCL